MMLLDKDVKCSSKVPIILRAKAAKVKHLTTGMDSFMDNLIKKLVRQQQKATDASLAQIARYVAAAPFAENLLAVDEPLWSGFWQGDVIAPGYRLPAVELALLRATRLDGDWPEETSVPRFLADLHQTILDPLAGIWTLTAASQPCAVFAAPVKTTKSITVVWYCASTGRLHAGYRTSADNLYLDDAITQRGLESDDRLKPTPKEKRDWLVQAMKQYEFDAAHSLAAQLDLEILRLRFQQDCN